MGSVQERIEEAIMAYIGSRKRKRKPELLIKAAKILAECVGYEHGITVDELAERLYGVATPSTRGKTMRVIHRVRKLLKTVGVNVYTIREPKGVRYCLEAPKIQYRRESSFPGEWDDLWM